MSIELQVALGGFILTLVGALAVFWAKIDTTFVRKDVDAQRAESQKELEAERAKGLDARLTTFEQKIDDLLGAVNRTQNLVQAEMPKAVREACVYGAREVLNMIREDPPPMLHSKRQ